MIVLGFNALSAEQWDTLVYGSPDGWPFGLTRWRSVILAVAEWQLEDHSFALMNNGQLAAVVPLQLDRRSGTLGVTGWGGCGPIVAGHFAGRARNDVLASVVEVLDGVAEKTSAGSLQFSVPPVTRFALANGRGVNPFSFHGFEDLSGIAQVIDLSLDESTLWRGLSEMARRAIRKAEKAGIIVEKGDWSAMLDDYYNLHVETYMRTGVVPHAKTYFSGIAQEMAPVGHSVLWVARGPSGDPIAFHNSMQFGVGAWYHTGCSTAAALDRGANHLLFWRSIIGAKAMGRCWYDCGEIFPRDEGSKMAGLTMFKTRFGGEPHRYLKAGKNYRAGREAPPRLAVGSVVKALARRICSRLQPA